MYAFSVANIGIITKGKITASVCVENWWKAKNSSVYQWPYDLWNHNFIVYPVYISHALTWINFN